MSEQINFNRLPGIGGDIGEIVLNRPRALNALTHEMCKEIRANLLLWEQDSKIKAVVIRAEGDRAFCAGGDVKAIYERRDNLEKMVTFFNDEYQMNKTIYHFSKPYISLLHGITMGGGAGVSLHGSHRVATEKFSFAMPETLIGFFPDIGAASFLNQCPDGYGLYLGLTGATINVEDAYALGLVNHVVPNNKLSSLLHTLCQSEFDSEDFELVSSIIARFESQVGESDLLGKEQTINHCFSKSTVESIVDSLSEVNTEFSAKVSRELLSRSPLSLKVTFTHLRQAKQLSFDDIMQMDFNLATQFLQENDFFEGVRAVLVDKDMQPSWQPPNLSDVDEQSVAKFFNESRQLV